MRAGCQICQDDAALAQDIASAGHHPTTADLGGCAPDSSIQPPFVSHDARATHDDVGAGGLGLGRWHVEQIDPLTDGRPEVEPPGRFALRGGIRLQAEVPCGLVSELRVSLHIAKTPRRSQQTASVVRADVRIEDPIVHEVIFDTQHAGFGSGGIPVRPTEHAGKSTHGIGAHGVIRSDRVTIKNVVSHIRPIASRIAVVWHVEIHCGTAHVLGDGVVVGPVLVEIDTSVVLEDGRGIDFAVDSVIKIIKHIPGHDDGGAGAFVARGDGIRVAGVDGPLVLAAGVETVAGDKGIPTEVDVLVTGEAVESVEAAIEHELAVGLESGGRVCRRPAPAVGIKDVLVPSVAMEVVIVDAPVAIPRQTVGESAGGAGLTC